MRYSTQVKSISHLKAKAAEVLRDLSERREPLIARAVLSRAILFLWPFREVATCLDPTPSSDRAWETCLTPRITSSGFSQREPT